MELLEERAPAGDGVFGVRSHTARQCPRPSRAHAGASNAEETRRARASAVTQRAVIAAAFAFAHAARLSTGASGALHRAVAREEARLASARRS